MKRSAIRCTLVVGMGVALILGFTGWWQVSAQSTETDWEKAAGGKMSFDVASVRQDATEPSNSTVHSNVPLDSEDLFISTGGLFSAKNYPLFRYMIFAYKLTPEQVQSVKSQLPKWANNNRYDIEARASSNPTKDQFRLMMQALLEKRFKLAVHFDKREMPVFVLLLDKPGKLGPHLQAHPPDVSCSTSPPPPGVVPGAAKVSGGFPELCGEIVGYALPNSPGQIWMGARNLSMAAIAASLNDADDPFTGIDRPVFDKTGLTGSFDFYLEFAPEANPDSKLRPDPIGTTFLEALKEQLGLKLKPEVGPVTTPVIGHIAEPTPN